MQLIANISLMVRRTALAPLLAVTLHHITYHYIDLTYVLAFNPEQSRDIVQSLPPLAKHLPLILPPTAYARISGEIVDAQLNAVGIQSKIQNTAKIIARSLNRDSQ